MSDDVRSGAEAELIVPASKALKHAITGKGRGRWAPGQSGNPVGFSKVYAQARRLCQERAPELAAELIELALTAQDERVKSFCLIACLDRAGIRPMDYDPSTDRAAAGLDVDRLTPEERAQLRGLVEKARVEGRGSAEGDDEPGAASSPE